MFGLFISAVSKSRTREVMDTHITLNAVLDEFLKISAIPRPSHHETQISEYLYQWALAHSLPVERDPNGNIIIEKQASTGYETAPLTILQAHMDMVCTAAEGVIYNPLADPIRVKNDGRFLTADGTSLGADNGIGMAICLYVLQNPHLQHGPLRVIFTVNEEDGMDAASMDSRYFNADYLINLDWEESGSLCNSCADSVCFTFSRSAAWEPVAEGDQSITLKYSGLKGGHSGMDIHRGRANAIACMATLLTALQQSGLDFRIAEFCGGQAINAIPSSAAARIVLRADDCARAKSLLTKLDATLQIAYGSVERTGTWNVSMDHKVPDRVLERAVGYALIELISVVPDGVHARNAQHPEFVESSSNAGLVRICDQSVSFKSFSRSSVEYRRIQSEAIFRSLAEHYGFDLMADHMSPAWIARPGSRLTDLACTAYKALTGEEMRIKSIHAGLECAVFAEKNPALDMIAIGPTLTDVHSPDEKCRLADVESTTLLLLRILEKLIS